MPRFESSRCFLHGALRERNANCPHHLKVANPAASVPLAPIEGVRLAAGGAGAKSETLFARSPSGVQGVPPDTPLVTFVVKRKSPGVEGRSAPSWGVQRGSAPRISGHAGAPTPAKFPRGTAVPPLPIPRNEQKVASQRATIKQKNLPSAGKNLRCAAAGARIGRAIMAQQKSEGIFPRLFVVYSKFSGAFDIPSRSRAPCCGCAWRSRLRRFPAG